MIDYPYGLPYRITRSLVVRAATAIALGRRRSLARDALTVIGHMPAPPLVRGADRIPEDGRFVVVANHYERPGLWMAWPSILISHIVQSRTGRETQWIAIQEWDALSLKGIDVPRPVIRAVFERAFSTYGIIAMPPEYAPAAARAGAMRLAAKAARGGGILGLMPEGTVGATPELLHAREGAGLFLLLLAAGGSRLLPVGLYEEEGRLVAAFGDPFHLELPAGVHKEERDRWAGNRVMNAIKALLPEPLWGAYDERAKPGTR